MIEKIRKAILKFLRLDDFQEDIKAKIKRLEDEYSDLNNRLFYFERLIHIGMDLKAHEKSNSWAVVCIGGNVQRILFLSLNRSDACHVQEFLKEYKNSDIILDYVRGLKLEEFMRW